MDYDEVDRSPELESHGLPVDEGDEEDWRERGPSESPIRRDSDASGSKARPRKRLIKKSHSSATETPEFVEDDEDGEIGGFGRDGSDGKRKKLSGSGHKEKWQSRDKYGGKAGGSGSGSRPSSKRGLSGKASRDQDGDVKEMWDTIAGGDSEVCSSLLLAVFFVCLVKNPENRVLDGEYRVLSYMLNAKVCSV